MKPDPAHTHIHTPTYDLRGWPESKQTRWLEQQFHAAFGKLNVRLCPALSFHDTDEPLYLPATSKHPARIGYAHGFTRSLLHEVSHWCLAGDARLTLEDYGYWYTPDTRSLEQQLKFEKAEVKPQAFEWLCTKALCLRFLTSADNLGPVRNHPDYDQGRSFNHSVYAQAKAYLHSFNQTHNQTHNHAQSQNTDTSTGTGSGTGAGASSDAAKVSESAGLLLATHLPPRAQQWLNQLTNQRSLSGKVLDLNEL